MTTAHTGQIDHPAAWRPSDFNSADDFAFDLEERHLDAIEEAMNAVVRAGKKLETLEDSDFAMPSIASELATVRRELTDGRGLVLMRGFPVEQYSVEEIGMIYWGIGSHFGQGTSQSRLGDRLGYVTHDPDVQDKWRGYRSTNPSGFHTDKDDIISLLCVRQAKTGGHSRLVSALSIHNEIAATRPDLLAPLYEGYYFHFFGERPPGAGAISDYKVPVFCHAVGRTSMIWLRGYMTHAAKERGEELPDEFTEALDLVYEIANRAETELQFPLNGGEAFFINNFELLHGRTGFEDYPEPERRRLLLRLWLEIDPPRPLHPNMRRYYDDLKLAYVKLD